MKISSIYPSGHAAPGATDDSVVSTFEHFLPAFPQQIVVAYECAFGNTSARQKHVVSGCLSARRRGPGEEARRPCAGAHQLSFAFGVRP